MKKVLFILIASFAFYGSIFAQQPDTHWPVFDYHSYNYQSGVVAAIMIDGQFAAEGGYDCNFLEVAAFVNTNGEECRGHGFSTDKYVADYGNSCPVLDGMPVYYDNSGDVVTFKLFDHVSGIEYDNCEILDDVSSISINTGDDHFEGWREPEHPIILSFTSPADNLELSDDGENAGTIEEHHENTVNVILKDRTLYKDEHWNTLFLPFAIDDIDASPLYGATIMELDVEGMEGETYNTRFDNGTLYLSFSQVESIQPGTPYIIKWEGGGDNLTEYDLVFSNVAIDATTNDVTSKDGSVTFKGTYNLLSSFEEPRSILFLGADDKLYWPEGETVIGAQRAYFLLNNGITAGDITGARLSFGGEQTAIREINTQRLDSSSYYDLNGRRLNKKPTRRGVYISNSRKLVVK